MKLNDAYSKNDWNNYAKLFASITTTNQLSVYKEACHYLSGDVIDCGCGSAKLAPMLLDRDDITSYTGIDYSQEMTHVAQYIVNQLNDQRFSIHESKIENYTGKLFDSAVSIQSYYSWSSPISVLRKIYTLLKPNGRFILATVNSKLPFDALAKDAWLELLMHPDFEAYKAYNLKLATNDNANFISLDALVKQLAEVGFQLELAHQQHFRGGLNFLVLQK